jgi:hypothetical protein
VALVEDYVRLCHDPMQDLRRWMAEDKRNKGAGRGVLSIMERGEHAQDLSAAGLAGADRLRGQPLHELQGRMDAHRNGWQGAHSLLARSRAGSSGNGELRPLRAEGRAGLESGQPASAAGEAAGEVIGGELAAVSAYYRARIAAARQGSPADIAALVQALRNEQTLAIRAVVERWQAGARASTERRQARHAAGRAPLRPLAGRHPS